MNVKYFHLCVSIIYYQFIEMIRYIQSRTAIGWLNKAGLFLVYVLGKLYIYFKKITIYFIHKSGIQLFSVVVTQFSMFYATL